MIFRTYLGKKDINNTVNRFHRALRATFARHQIMQTQTLRIVRSLGPDASDSDGEAEGVEYQLHFEI
jgi:hypothetical protein